MEPLISGITITRMVTKQKMRAEWMFMEKQGKCTVKICWRWRHRWRKWASAINKAVVAMIAIEGIQKFIKSPPVLLYAGGDFWYLVLYTDIPCILHKTLLLKCYANYVII